MIKIIIIGIGILIVASIALSIFLGCSDEPIETESEHLTHQIDKR